MKQVKSYALCEGRHKILEATDGAIYPNIVNPLDIMSMRKTAEEKIKGCTAVNVYVTGLTVALVEVINVCRYYNIPLTLYHFNRDSGDYYPQEVIM